MAKDMFVRAKTLKIKGIDVQPVTPCSFSLRIISIYIIIYIKLINYFLLCPVVGSRFGDFISTHDIHLANNGEINDHVA